MNKATGTGSIDRSARVRLIKRVIITLVMLAIFVPTILCIILFCKMGKMEKQIQELSLRKEKVTVVAESTVVREAAASDAVAGVVNTGTIVKNESNESNVLNAGTAVNSQLPANVTADGQVVLPNVTADGQVVVPGVTPSVNAATMPAVVQGTVPVGMTPVTQGTGLKPYSERRVYLTFDDGSNYNTGKILDVLNAKGVKATFFVIGNENETSYNMCRRIVTEGHAIGMHSYSHVYKRIYASEQAFEEDLNMIQMYIYRTAGIITNLYRFPGGSSNRVSKLPMTTFENMLTNRGILYYDWNVSSGDAESKTLKSKNEIINNCIRGVERNNDSIILLHDLPGKKTTLEALPELIDRLQAMGVQILPIDMNAPVIHH